jgi:threonine aldolase
MRQAIASAAVGDEQSGEDPTVLELEQRVAAMLGHDAGLFLPSGTMCNLVAMCLHMQVSGEEVILARQSHLMRSEAGGGAVVCGAMFNPIDTASGVFDEEQLRAAIRSPNIGAPRSRLLAVEQTVNWTGGTVWPVEQLRSVTDLARTAGMNVHLDGARLMNAAVSLEVGPAAFTALCDTASLDFTKGLGAPLGAVLAMPGHEVARARRFKRMLGGGLRQAGICAAACCYALDHNVTGLEADHINAQRLARAIARVPGCSLPEHGVHTNIVLVKVPDAARFSAMLRADGVLVSQASRTEVRFVTHLDVDELSVSYVEHVLAGYDLLAIGGASAEPAPRR